MFLFLLGFDFFLDLDVNVIMDVGLYSPFGKGREVQGEQAVVGRA